MSVKLFVTDLDGTLLPSGKDVPRENIEAVQKAVRAGVIVTIATGRMYRAALPVAEALGVDAAALGQAADADHGEVDRQLPQER